MRGVLEIVELEAARPDMTRWDLSNCLKATLLSNHVRGASPQSTIVAQSSSTFSPYNSVSLTFRMDVKVSSTPV